MLVPPYPGAAGGGKGKGKGPGKGKGADDGGQSGIAPRQLPMKQSTQPVDMPNPAHAAQRPAELAAHVEEGIREQIQGDCNVEHQWSAVKLGTVP